jgi:ABC-type lipoprotein release transport system permease subunit
MLFEVQPTDPATYAAVAVLLLIVAAGACYFPACRASHVDPLIARRAD